MSRFARRSPHQREQDRAQAQDPNASPVRLATLAWNYPAAICSNSVVHSGLIQLENPNWFQNLDVKIRTRLLNQPNSPAWMHDAAKQLAAQKYAQATRQQTVLPFFTYFSSKGVSA